jgi:hypothetical protein
VRSGFRQSVKAVSRAGCSNCVSSEGRPVEPSTGRMVLAVLPEFLCNRTRHVRVSTVRLPFSGALRHCLVVQAAAQPALEPAVYRDGSILDLNEEFG